MSENIVDEADLEEGKMYRRPPGWTEVPGVKVNESDLPRVEEPGVPKLPASERVSHMRFGIGDRIVLHRILVELDERGDAVREIAVPTAIVKGRLNNRSADGKSIMLDRGSEPQMSVPTGDYLDGDLLSVDKEVIAKGEKLAYGRFVCRVVFYPHYRVDDVLEQETAPEGAAVNA